MKRILLIGLIILLATGSIAAQTIDWSALLPKIPATVTPTQTPLPVIPRTLPVINSPTPTQLPVIPTVTVTPLPVMLATVWADALNVRECASMFCEPIDWLMNGEQVEIEFCNHGWALLADRRGWVWSAYLDPDHCEQNND